MTVRPESTIGLVLFRRLVHLPGSLHDFLLFRSDASRFGEFEPIGFIADAITDHSFDLSYGADVGMIRHLFVPRGSC